MTRWASRSTLVNVRWLVARNGDLELNRPAEQVSAEQLAEVLRVTG